MRYRLVVVALVVLWIVCVGGEPAAHVIGDNLRCAPIHPHLINVSSGDLSVEPGKRSSEITTRPQATMTLISRGVLASASTGNASLAADSSYDTWWQARSPTHQCILSNLNGAGHLSTVFLVSY